MARQYGVEKVHILAALALVAQNQGAPSGELVRLLIDTFHCSKRAAIDALSILREAECIAHVRDTEDQRLRRYYLTTRGWWCLVHPVGGILLRYARQLFTRCGSPRVRQRQDQARERHRDLDTAFAWAAASLMSGNHTRAVSAAGHRLAIDLALARIRGTQ